MAPGRSILELGVGSASLSIPKSDQIMNEPFTSFYLLSFLIVFDDEPLGILSCIPGPGRPFRRKPLHFRIPPPNCQMSSICPDYVQISF